MTDHDIESEDGGTQAFVNTTQMLVRMSKKPYHSNIQVLVDT